ncbi:hypothetical protein K2173_026286 [Erythroxylum novogranatense]|uniref:DUF789 family protein n=1 Tax=Erythroxylum novogranatense TaxID=1862640 RepID=A0AAV8SBQ6_9ROSI|nr:hypothetical protein K2173_026286 [Erythroxylum novogranatense]
MPNAMTRTHHQDRFYNPPPMRRHHQQLQRPVHKGTRPELAVNETRSDSDVSTLSRVNSVCSASPTGSSSLTNLDRVLEAVTPFVPVEYSTQGRSRGWRNHEADTQPFFCLGELWESFREWSVYGVGVPLSLKVNDTVNQYYVPSLSGIQLYTDQHSERLWRRHNQDSDVGPSRDASSANRSECEAEKHVKVNVEEVCKLALMDKPPKSSSGDEKEIYNCNGLLAFEYFEQEQPHARKPLYDKVSSLASQFPGIKIYQSCDLLPASWVSVAWYPIYRIPVGPTLQNLDASFLTFHTLSTNVSATGIGKNHIAFAAPSVRKRHGGGASSRMPLPAFGLASYKLRGSILTPSGSDESQKANSLLQAADNWLQKLEVNLPDFQFFVSHNSQWR